jgi:hypothetical protein
MAPSLLRPSAQTVIERLRGQSRRRTEFCRGFAAYFASSLVNRKPGKFDLTLAGKIGLPIRAMATPRPQADLPTHTEV